MNREKVIFAFFIILALTLNFGFVFGEIADPHHHSPWELFAAIIVNLIATVLKFGDRTHIGSVLLATSLVADLQLIASATIWGYTLQVSAQGYNVEAVVTVVSLASGALVANIISVILLTAETLMVRR
jgi:hypothetical protein